MITGWTIYWIVILNGVIRLFVSLFVVSVIGGIIGSVVFGYEITSCLKEDKLKAVKVYKKFMFYIVCVFCVSSVALVFTPNAKHAAAIIIAPRIINAVAGNEELQKLPDNITKLANDWIVELSPKRVNSEAQK